MADGDVGSVRKAFCWSLQWKGNCSLPGVTQAAQATQYSNVLQQWQHCSMNKFNGYIRQVDHLLGRVTALC